MKDPRLTQQSLKVLLYIMKNPSSAGIEITDKTGVKSGTLYTLLGRFTETGWLTQTWEKTSPKVLGRPNRCFYTLTDEGTIKLKKALKELT